MGRWAIIERAALYCRMLLLLRVLSIVLYSSIIIIVFWAGPLESVIYVAIIYVYLYVCCPQIRQIYCGAKLLYIAVFMFTYIV